MSFTSNPQVVASGEHVVGTIYTYPEAASQTYKKGQLVYLATAKVTAVASDDQLILGIAMEDASGTTDTDAPVMIITPTTLVRIQSTAAPAVGTQYAVVVSSNICKLDQSDTTNDAMVVVDNETDAGGTATGWSLVNFLSGVCQFPGVKP